MASSYQPGVRRVGLGAPSSRGFSPVQAADNSEAVLRRGQSDLESLSRVRQFNLKSKAEGIEALLDLSKTALDFTVKRQEVRNENDRKLGIADILNGDMQPKPEARQAYRDNTQLLRNTAVREQQSLNELEDARPDVALEVRATDPVISGWRQYGQAQGIAMKAAASAEGLLDAAYLNPNKNIPITDAQGNTRMIAASEANSTSEMNAVWAVILQGFIGASGLDGINPLLLAENVTPRIMELKASIFKREYGRIAAAQRDEAQMAVTARLGGALANTDLRNPQALARVFQFGGEELAAATNKPRSEADELVYRRMLAEAWRRKDGDAIKVIKGLPRAADGSMSLGTLDMSFPDVADEVASKIVAFNEAEAERQKKAQQATVENAVKAYQLSIIGQPPDKVEQAWSTQKQLLTEMVSAGVQGADLALIAHEQKPKRQVSQSVEDNFVAAFAANPGRYTKAQVEKSIADGEFSPGIINRLTFPEDVAGPMAKPYKKQAYDAAKAFIASQLTASSFKGTDLEGAEVVTRSNQLGAELFEAILRVAAQKKGLTDEDVNATIEKILKRAGDPKTGDSRFLVSPTRSTRPGRPVQFLAPLQDRTAAVNQTAAGATTRIDYSFIKPADFRGVPVRPGDQVIAPGTLETSAETYRRTGSFPGDQLPAVRATALTQTEFIRNQTGEPRSLADLAQGLQLAIQDNPRSTPLELFAANWQIQRKQLLLQGQQVAPGALAPETADLLRDLGKKEGGARAYEAANSGTAMDMPNGIPGLTGMTLKQVQASGARHVGKYQFKLGQGQALAELTTRLGLTGDEKFTPELQDRMAAELIWGGWKRPALTAYLKGGGNLEQAVADFNNEWEAGKLTFNARPYLLKMRAAYQVRGAGAVGQAGNFSKANVTSVSYERKGRGDSYQPGGVDIYFRDKQFPALAAGKVIETGNEPGGYGLWVVTEHVDPKTGQTFQLINAHMDAIHVKAGQSINVGTVLGRQGSTGTTSAGGIASIDPIMPAPRGSRAQVPYARPAVLKELLGTLIR
jgi:murein DD-endopeptidase MepM/ murein hydrolase activator NlpD